MRLTKMKFTELGRSMKYDFILSIGATEQHGHLICSCHEDTADCIASENG